MQSFPPIHPEHMHEDATGVGSGVFNLSHSGLISQFLAYPFPFREWLP